jgi:hypothetical protein
MHFSTGIYNATWEYAAIREMLSNLIGGATALGMYADEVPTWKRMIGKLRPYEMNAQGVIREWLHPDLYDNPGHRHLTHVYPLMPGLEINKEETSRVVCPAPVKSASMDTKDKIRIEDRTLTIRLPADTAVRLSIQL